MNEDDDDNLYRIRRELEDKIIKATKKLVESETSRLQWRYGSVLAGLGIGAAILGFTAISDIPDKIDSALRSEASTEVISQIEQKEKEINDIYTRTTKILTNLESKHQLVTKAVIEKLKIDDDFIKRAKGPKGDAGSNGERGYQGNPGVDGVFADLPSFSEVGTLSIKSRIGSDVVVEFKGNLGNEIIYIRLILDNDFKKPFIDILGDGRQSIEYKLTKITSFFVLQAIAYVKLKKSGVVVPYAYKLEINPLKA